MFARTVRPLGIALVLLTPLASCGGGTGDHPLPPRPSATANLSPGTLEQVDRILDEIEAEPDIIGHRLKLAATYEANQVADLALETYEQVAEMDPERPKSWYHLGRLRAATGDPTGCLEAFAEVESRDNTYAPLYWKKGQLLLQLARFDEAEQAFLRAGELDPSDPSSGVGLAEVALARGNAELAVRALEDLYGKMPDKRIGKLLKKALTASGQVEKANALVIDESSPSHIYRKDPWLAEIGRLNVMGVEEAIELADARLQLGNPQGALEVLTPVLASDPSNVDLMSRATQALIELKQYDPALDMLNAAAANMPGEFRVEFLRGNVLHRKGLLPEAMDALMKATELSPSAGDCFFALARVQADMGQLDSSLASVQKAHELGFRSPKSVMLEGRLFLELRRIDEAITTFEEAMQEYPREVAPVAYLAAAQVERGYFDKAEETLAEVELRKADHPMIPRIRARMEMLKKSGQMQVLPLDGQGGGEGGDGAAGGDVKDDTAGGDGGD